MRAQAPTATLAWIWSVLDFWFKKKKKKKKKNISWINRGVTFQFYVEFLTL